MNCCSKGNTECTISLLHAKCDACSGNMCFRHHEKIPMTGHLYLTSAWLCHNCILHNHAIHYKGSRARTTHALIPASIISRIRGLQPSMTKGIKPS